MLKNEFWDSLGAEKILKTNWSNVMNWIKKSVQRKAEKVSAQRAETVELDELYWFVESKSWTQTRENLCIMTMVSRKPRQTVGYLISRNKSPESSNRWLMPPLRRNIMVPMDTLCTWMRFFQESTFAMSATKMTLSRWKVSMLYPNTGATQQMLSPKAGKSPDGPCSFCTGLQPLWHPERTLSLLPSWNPFSIFDFL